MKVISASRRTDLVAFFPEYLSQAISKREISVFSPTGYTYRVDLSPGQVHTFVLWSKDFTNLLQNIAGLRTQLSCYDQLYLHFTITGLGGSFIEPGVPPPYVALSQLEELIEITRLPARISVRFDPIVYWWENENVKTNLYFFEKMAPLLDKVEIRNIRLSFAQWYGKCIKRARKHRFLFFDPPREKKREDAAFLTEIARTYHLILYACSQQFLTDVKGIQSSRCIDGPQLTKLHPYGYPTSFRKDKGQRKECLCTESTDIGSYTQSCPHSCLYCYANTRM